MSISSTPSSPFSALQSALAASRPTPAAKPATTEKPEAPRAQPSQPGGLVGHTIDTTA